MAKLAVLETKTRYVGSTNKRLISKTAGTATPKERHVPRQKTSAASPTDSLKRAKSKKQIRLRPVRRLEKEEKGLPRDPTLGYRGLIIEQIGKGSQGLPRVRDAECSKT